MLRDRDWITRHIPHSGEMCLLDGVLAWDSQTVRCLSRRHRDPRNPLKDHHGVGVACGIEFAAQAMAVHGALLATAPESARRPGYLVVVRSVRFEVARLDDLADDLIVSATLAGGDTETAAYAFQVTAARRLLLAGRAMILVDPEASSSPPSGIAQ